MVLTIAMTLASGALTMRFASHRLVAVLAAVVMLGGCLTLAATAWGVAWIGIVAAVLNIAGTAGLGVPIYNMIYRWAEGTGAATDYALLFGCAFLTSLPARLGAPAVAGARLAAFLRGCHASLRHLHRAPCDGDAQNAGSRGGRHMIPSLVADAPESLAAMTAKMAIGPAATGVAWWNARSFDGVLAQFGAPYERPDRRALASLWSQYYFVALIIPTTVAMLRRDLVLPVAADEVSVVFDVHGQVDRILLRDAGHTYDGPPGVRFDRLVRGHVQPFVEACAACTRLSRRVLWSNAATVLDYAVSEMAASASTVDDARAEAERLLSAGSTSSLRAPFDRATDGSSMRRVCCLRYRLAGVPRCAGLCPLDRQDGKAPPR